MATEYATVTVVVVVDQAGDYAAGTDDEGAAERYREEVREPDGTLGLRVVRLSVKVPLPVPIELSGEVTADETAAELRVA